ncbi:hypothetical protein OG455_06765 [Kitasatospora sp. NBC_01287]|uniref:hypothetical protein n=1 Tax=Kitasatospora sp. NBC_01287 TaxID=2903573 RepID=UPI00225A6D39|nr:hypothetical protein [Kitasatospora sp. NBC_01287]MCX4745225.1 hypothetical protein [Kitasatospora sp. NBC_01287]
MPRRRTATSAAIAVTTIAALTATAGPALADANGSAIDGFGARGHHHGSFSYGVGTPVVDKVKGGPWTLGQGDLTLGASYGNSLPVYAGGGTGTVTVGGVTYPNLAVDPAGTGSVPAASGVTGTPGPLDGYCSSGGATPETGTVVRQPKGSVLPMQPYYFPFVTSQDGGETLSGLFDYRPKDGDEAVVAATSTDHGKTWKYAGEALEQNAGLCPDGNTNDDGQGHAFVLNVPDYAGTGHHGQVLYTLSRPSGDTLGTNLIVHHLTPKDGDPLAGLPAAEPVGMGGGTAATGAVGVPAGPGGAGVTINVGSTANFEQPGHFSVDGVTVDCNDAAATATAFTGCTTRTAGGVSVKAGDAITADSVIPATAQQTSGLIAPDGIISTLPHYPGAPKGSVAVLYTEKIVNYFTPTTTTAAVTLPAATIPVADSSALKPAAGGAVTVSLGTAAGIVQATCTGADATDLTGCTGGTGAVAKGSSVGAPGAATVPYARLAQIGEGKNKPKSLYGNNEDYTVVRAAYTTDGLHFTDLGQVNGLADPTSTSDSVLRWTGSRGTVITNPDGSLGLFLSGAYASDGDSDAFNQIFYSSSKDGKTWSAPQKLLSTDYGFSALAEQAATGGALGVSGYYSGRVYDPTVVRNDNGTLTMVFAGYATPKPLPGTGSVYGTDPAAPFTVPAVEPAEYRTILSVTLKPHWTN